MSQLNAQVNKLLTNVSNAYIPQGFIAENVLPSIEVKQSSGILGYYGKSHLRLENSIVGGRGKARKVEAIVRNVDRTYLIQAHELQGEVTEDDYANVELPFDAEKDETLGLTSLIAIEKEYLFATSVQNSSIITQNVTLSGTSKFSDYLNSNPIAVVKTGRAAVLSGCGSFPNKAIVPALVADCLSYHPQVLQNLGFAQNRAGQLTHQEIAKFLGVDEIFVPDTAYNSAKEGQTDSMTQIFGNHITFMVCPKAASKHQVSFGYYIKKSGGTKRVKKWNIEETFGNTGILVGDNYQFRIVDATAAYLIKDCI
jgi:hypothetical protein